MSLRVSEQDPGTGLFSGSCGREAGIETPAGIMRTCTWTWVVVLRTEVENKDPGGTARTLGGGHFFKTEQTRCRV